MNRSSIESQADGNKTNRQYCSENNHMIEGNESIVNRLGIESSETKNEMPANEQVNIYTRRDRYTLTSGQEEILEGVAVEFCLALLLFV